VDTTTLDIWIERNRTYDDALARLYQALHDANGRVTDAARDAFTDVQRAQKLLPPDTRAIVVIMSDLAQGGLNQAAIRIEEARGALTAAVAAVD
jgi:sirohydrochlorin ferrochelatase